MPRNKKGSAKTEKGGQTAPQQHKTPEQIEVERKQMAEAKRQRDLVVKELWPLLLKGTTSISNATQFMGTLQMTVQQAFNNQMREQKLESLKIVENIDPKAAQADYYGEFLTILANEPVAVVLGLMKGINDELERLFRKEMAERSLASLKTDFIEDKENGNENKN